MSGSRAVILRAMGPDDLDLVAGWLGDPEVARWYLAGTTLADELDELRAAVRGADPTEMLVAESAGVAVGWCQNYLCGDYPEWAEDVGASAGDVGIDYAIGVPGGRGRGLGTMLIAALVAWVRVTHPGAGVIADPDAENAASRRVLEKNGFVLTGVRPLASEATDTPLAIYRLSGGSQ